MICVSLVEGTYITRDKCLLARRTYNTSDMCSAAGEDISLVMCVSWEREHISLVICVSQVGEHIQLGICVSREGEHGITSEMCFPGRAEHILLMYSNMCLLGRGTYITSDVCSRVKGKTYHKGYVFSGRGNS